MSKAEEIRSYLEENCAVVRNFRGWDYECIMAHGEFARSDDVLDTGAMHTYFCTYLAQYVELVIATDSFSWAKRAYMQEQALPSREEWCREVEEIAPIGHLVAEYADVQELLYEDGTFNKVLSISTIEHVQDDGQAMHEMMRVLRPEGLLLLTTELGLTNKPYSEDEPGGDGSYYRIYDPTSLFHLLTCVPGTELQHLETSRYPHDEEVTGKEITIAFCKVRKC